MQSLTQIRDLLSSHGLAPKKSLGQNFLIDQNLIRKLVDAAGVSPADLILEIGPGTGTLTEELLARGAQVIACELDTGLAALLRERFGGVGAASLDTPGGAGVPPAFAPPIDELSSRSVSSLHPSSRFTLIEGDCLQGKQALNPAITAALAGRSFKLVANLPYGAGTPLLLTLLTAHPECGTMAITVQREVADRLAAEPGGKEYGALSVVAQALGAIKPVATLPPECFWPRPDVTSSMVLLKRLAEPLAADAAGLAEACRRIFAQRRKQLGSVLGRGLDWPAGIDPRQRAEELPVPAIVALAAVLKRSGPGNETPQDANSQGTD